MVCARIVVAGIAEPRFTQRWRQMKGSRCRIDPEAEVARLQAAG
jgi:hypothetical protein